MQVERKPPLWPYLAVLLLMLGMCVAAPRYWTVLRTDRTTHEPAAAQAESARQSRQRLPLVVRSRTTGLRLFLPSSDDARSTASSSGSSGRLVLVAPPDAVRRQPSLANILPGMDLGAMLRRLGRQVAVWQPEELPALVGSLVAQQLERLPPAPKVVVKAPARRMSSPPALVGPLLIASPTDRLAMIPDRADDVPDLQVPSLGVAEQPWEKGLLTSTESPWQVPHALVEQLQQLETHAESAAWATCTLSVITQLTDPAQSARHSADEQLRRLAELADQAETMAAVTDRARLAIDLRRVHYALERRVGMWMLVSDIRTAATRVPHARSEGDRQLQAALARLTEITAGSQRGAEWQDYLLTDALAEAAGDGARISPAVRRELARKILVRVTTGALNPDQRQFVRSAPIAAVAGEMRHWAAERVDVDRLLLNLEGYELTRSPRLAQVIAHERSKLQWSPSAEHRLLAEHIDQHYRNANFRVAVTGELLDQLLPEPEQAGYQPVRDRVVGTPIRGRQRTNIMLKSRLVPDENFLRFALVAEGDVQSRTVAYGDGARLWTCGVTNFSAQKFVTVMPEGMRIYPATGQANSYSRLVRVRTDYDRWPLIGSWARSEAESQFRQRRGRARMAVEQKVTQGAQEKLDAEMGPYLARLQARTAARMDTLRLKGVHVEPITLATTERRIVARLRVAGDDHLAAHTPRNRAPADSLASVQMHESVLTNLSRCLELDGQRLTAVELRDLLMEKLGKGKAASDDEVPSDTIFHFAYEDALQFLFDDGQMELLLDIVELVHDSRPIRRFKVHAFYEPRIEGTRITLARTGALGIEGRIRTGDRARLHAVFNKVLSENTEIPVFDPETMGLTALDGVMITQAVLEDGWFGVAIGPEAPGRTAQRLRSIR